MKINGYKLIESLLSINEKLSPRIRSTRIKFGKMRSKFKNPLKRN